ncbi:FAD-dependent oxidoreductase, partial [Escherichia coli]|uniref:FAD-dependent oxidoreductase n=1 Tax=Escherichia coli TaxID=562 RepID=UPI0019152D97
HKVPAGSALAVDRDRFSDGVTAALAAHPNIEIVRERVDVLPDTGLTIVATGPLTAPALADMAGRQWGERLIRSWNEGWIDAPQRIGGKIAALIGAEPDEVIVAD